MVDEVCSGEGRETWDKRRPSYIGQTRGSTPTDRQGHPPSTAEGHGPRGLARERERERLEEGPRENRRGRPASREGCAVTRKRP